MGGSVVEGFRAWLQSLVYRGRRWLWALLGRLVNKDGKLWRLVSVTGIVVFVGPNGSGKSLAAVQACLEAIDTPMPWRCWALEHHHNEPARVHWQDCEDCDRDYRASTGEGLCEDARLILDVCGVGERLVYSTVPLLDADGRNAERYRPLVDFRQLVTVEHSDVLFDEVAGVSDSSDSAGVPVQVTNWLHQLRKRDVRLRVTTPAYARCSKPIRQVAQVVVDSRSFFPVLGSDGRLWRSRQAMLYRAYDAFAFEDYTSSTKDRLRSMAGFALWRPGSRAENGYDTLAAVLALGHVMEGGMCSVCGGSRSKPRCGCPPEVDHVPMHRLQVVERVTASGARYRAAEVVPGPVDDVGASGHPAGLLAALDDARVGDPQ